MKAAFGGVGGHWEITELLFTANAERAGPQKESRDLRDPPPPPPLSVSPSSLSVCLSALVLVSAALVL